MELMKAISERIKELMIEEKLTQKELAKKANISLTTLNRILNVKQKDINSRIVAMISKALNKSLKDFFDTQAFNEISKHNDD